MSNSSRLCMSIVTGMLLLAAPSLCLGAVRLFDFEGAEYGIPDPGTAADQKIPMFNRAEYGVATRGYVHNPAGYNEGTTSYGSDAILTTTSGNGKGSLNRFSWNLDVQGLNWNNATLQLVDADSSGAFANYTWSSGDKITLVTGYRTAIPAGGEEFTIAAKNDDNTITLTGDVNETEGDVTDGSILGAIDAAMPSPPTGESPWIRIPLYSASGVTPVSASPTVDVRHNSTVSMKIAAVGLDKDGFENLSGALEVALLICESDLNLPLGENGGTTGFKKMAGVTGRGATGGDANTPLGGISIQSQHYGVLDFPPVPLTYTTVTWTFKDNDTNGDIEAVDVNGVLKSVKALSGSTDPISCPNYQRGTLDSLLVHKPAGDNTSVKWYVFIDDVRIEAPGIVDPVRVDSPVVSYMTTATVSLIDPNASQVRLYKNDVLYKSPSFTPGSAPSSHTFTDCTFVPGDKLEATQVVGGTESAKSVAVYVADTAFLKDNFDGYADQAALNAVWPTTCIQPIHVSLTQQVSASCNQSLLDPTAPTTASVCGVYHDLGGYYNGTDDVPLTLTVWMYHGAGTSGNSWVELSSYSGAGWNQGTLQQQLLIGTCSWTPPGDTTVYNGREAMGAGAPNWFNITGATRLPNTWVKLQIKVKTSTIDYLVNGVGVTQPRTRPSTEGFNAVAIGSRYVSGVPAYFDNISLSLGEPPTEPYGDPNPTPPPTLAVPVLPNSTSVTVNDVVTGATDVKIYADDSLVGTATASVPTTVVTVSSLSCGATVTAAQVKDGIESCYSAAVAVSNPLPTIPGPLTQGDTTVSVENIDAAATLVKVYANNSLVGSAAVSGEATKAVPVTALVAGQAVEAAQVIAGQECGRSTPVTVNQPILNGWTATSLLPVGTAEPVVLYLNGYMYCIAGRTAAGVVTDAVYYAVVNADGSLGAWTVTASLPWMKTTHAGAAYNGRVYVWGGYDNSGPTQGTCFYAQPNPDGSITSWNTSAVSLPAPGGVQEMELIGNGVHIWHDNIYTINGANNNGVAQSVCYVSKISSGGDIGAWQTTTSTPTVRKYLNTAVVETASGAYIYRVAGADLVYTAQPDTVKGTLAADGTITSWTQQTPLIPVSPASPIVTGLFDHAVAVADGRIFVVCGLDDTNAPQDLVYFTEVNPTNGDIGPWKQEAHAYPMKIGRNAAVGYQHNGAWYILGVGGQSSGYTTRKQECYYAKLSSCVAPSVDSIAPNTGRQDTTVHVTIGGLNFAAGATVQLRQAGNALSPINATNVVVVNATTITADIPLTGGVFGAMDGAWDVVVTTCAEGVKAGAFTVSSCNTPPQDSDGDHDVDLGDFATFQTCFNGPNRPYGGGPTVEYRCRCMDVDPDDLDVDLTDFGRFQTCFNGPNRPANCS